MEIKITINGLDQLTEALALIGSALALQKGMVNTAEAAEIIREPYARQPVQVVQNQHPAPIQQPAPQYQAPQSVPVQQSVQQQPQIDQQQMQGVPVQTQTYSMEQLAVAATQLVDAGRRTELVGLLQQFGVQALTALPKEQYGNFATQLRAMGAKI
ncbi:hypothetical protein [Tissierella sp.]|jgi:hypothetical protein|uniref:hypothetical protein n=1 Tax=Tissierella sp. TaxID=41274 RepID=UPI003072C5E3